LREPKPIRKFWRGALPSTLRTGVGSALYFASLNTLRQHVATSRLFSAANIEPTKSGQKMAHSSSLPTLSNIANLTTGAVSRVSVGFVMMPITVIKVRYESNLYSYRSLLGASSDILRTEGIRGLFSGFGATAIRDAPYAGLYVLFYERCKKKLSHLAYTISSLPSKDMGNVQGGMRSSTSASINFVSGVVAAGSATAITNPFDAIKTRIQLQPSEYRNMAHAARRIVQEDGLKSLFDGLGLRMGRKALSSALAWTVYEEVVSRAEQRWRENNKLEHS
jgi:solute carrier family 25 protein 38